LTAIIDKAILEIKKLQKRNEKASKSSNTDPTAKIYDCMFLIDVVKTYTAMFTIGTEHDLYDINSIMTSLVAAYKLATIAASDMSTPANLSTLDMKNIFNDADCIDKLTSTVRTLKRHILSLVSHYTCTQFLDTPSSETLESLCNFMLSMFEKCGILNGCGPCV
jgi:hypothetical protein